MATWHNPGNAGNVAFDQKTLIDVSAPASTRLGVPMEATAAPSNENVTAVYDRVVREVRQSFGDRMEDDQVVRVAHEAVDDFLVRQSARVITFVPVLAMRRIRESIDATATADDSIAASA